MNIRTTIRIFLTALTMTLALAGCPSDSGYSDDSSDSGNGCDSGYCRSNGACCIDDGNHQYWCDGTCYSTYSAMQGAGCSSYKGDC